MIWDILVLRLVVFRMRRFGMVSRHIEPNDLIGTVLRHIEPNNLIGADGWMHLALCDFFKFKPSGRAHRALSREQFVVV